MTLLAVPVLSLQDKRIAQGRKIMREMGDMSLKAKSSTWTRFQASSGEKFLPCCAMPVKCKDMKKGSKTDYAINNSEVTPACLLSSPGKMRFSPFLQWREPIPDSHPIFSYLAMRWIFCLAVSSFAQHWGQITYSCYVLVFLHGKNCEIPRHLNKNPEIKGWVPCEEYNWASVITPALQKICRHQLGLQRDCQGLIC